MHGQSGWKPRQMKQENLIWNRKDRNGPFAENQSENDTYVQNLTIIYYIVFLTTQGRGSIEANKWFTTNKGYHRRSLKYISHDEQCTTVGSIGCSFVPVQCPSSAPTSPPSTIGLVLANIPWWSIYAGGPLFPYVTAYRMYCSASVKGNKIKFKGVGREKLRRNCV